MPGSKTKNVSSKSSNQGTVNYERLRGLNILAAGLNLLQGILVLYLSNAGKGLQPISIHYLTHDRLASAVSGQSVVSAAVRHLYDLKLAYVLAAFFFVGALGRLLATTVYRSGYESGLKTRINKLRWVELALTGGLMMSTVAMLSGILDVAALVMIFALTAVAGLLGWAAENSLQSGRSAGWLGFWVGSLAGAAAWLAIATTIIGALVFNGSIPVFIYFIYLSMFLLAAAFAANLYLQLKKSGRQGDYLYSERSFIFLSLFAEAALAWQVFFGALH